MIKFAIVGDPDRIPDFIRRKFPEVRTEIGASMGRIVLKLARKIKEEKLSGQVLKTRTGALRRSISPSVEQGATAITGIVGTNKIYARAHEFGVTTKAHDIFPKKRKALAWLKGGYAVPEKKGIFKATGEWTRKGGKALGEMGALSYAKHVRHPGSVIPERSFMRTALNEMSPEIRREFEGAIFGVFGK
jgi:phage gpG-like protein